MELHEVKIRFQDWILIYLVGILIGASLGYPVGVLTDDASMDSILHGALSGLAIALVASILISLLHRRIFPAIPEGAWNLLGILFSFLAGFIGFLCAQMVAELLGVANLKITQHSLMFASITGIDAVLIGAILYALIRKRNQGERLQLLCTQGRLKSLEAQINPHFLFNALNSLSELIYSDARKAEQMVLELSDFMRYGSDEKSTIPLQQEMDIVQKFIRIHSIRFPGQIILESAVMHDSLGWRIPKFSIQLLVENAIKHGKLAGRILHIRIASEREGVIRVSDDGKGFESLAYGRGLSNLEERLKLLNEGVLCHQRKDGWSHFEMHLKEGT